MSQIGGYGIQRELSARQSYLAVEAGGRRVVLKVLDADCLQKRQLHPLVYDRLGRVRELAHLGVANLHGVQRDGGRAFLVWEYIEGKTLEEYLADGNPAELPRLAQELVSAVESLHALGIVHGALHGRNIIVTPLGGLKLTHLSPLLYSEPEVDVEALLALLSTMGFASTLPRDPSEISLRQIAQCVSTESGGSPVALLAACGEGGFTEARRARWAALLGAAAAAALGAATAWGVWRFATHERSSGGPDLHSFVDRPVRAQSGVRS